MTQSDLHLEDLLQYLKEYRGFDFTGYKRASLTRRIHRRMEQVDMPGYVEYLDYLQVHPAEFTALFNSIFINVTGFFRDPDAWLYLQKEVLPELLAEKEPNAPVRVWSAGCASGEEAYTLAMVLAELMGPEQFRQQVKIYATDVDEEELAQARLGSYTERQINGVPKDMLDRYFDVDGGRYVFRKDLRRSIIFGRNDLVQDAPISRADLIVCRNLLMYFNAETQARILSRFHFGLVSGGVLFLGKAEMLLSHGKLFVPVDLKRRIFRRAAATVAGNPGPPVAQPLEPPPRGELVGLDRLRDEAFMTCPVAQVVVTVNGLVALTNRQAEALLGVSTRDIGRPFRDLGLSYRPVELRGYIDQAQVERRPIRVPNIEYVRNAHEAVYLEVEINPLIDTDARLLGVVLVFHDITASRQLQKDLERANREAEAAHEELQSTNEELETTNEELQSTNDELQNINVELRERTAELDSLNAFLEAVLSSLRAGVVVIDGAMQVRAWNRRAEDLWGLREDEVLNEHFLNLDIGLPTDLLRPLVRRVLSGEADAEQMVVEAVNRRGRTVQIRVVGTPLNHNKDGSAGAILLMETEDSGAI